VDWAGKALPKKEERGPLRPALCLKVDFLLSNFRE